MTRQHPAAPETETDANGLRELLAAATPGPWEAWENSHAEMIVSEAGRRAFGVVTNPATGREDYGRANALLIAAAVNALPALLADLDAARERVRVVEGQRDAEAEQSAYWHTMQQRYEARAESAEAAHEAEKAAHERLRAGVEALCGWGVGRDTGGVDRMVPSSDLRSLLGGGEAR